MMNKSTKGISDDSKAEIINGLGSGRDGADQTKLLSAREKKKVQVEEDIGEEEEYNSRPFSELSDIFTEEEHELLDNVSWDESSDEEEYINDKKKIDDVKGMGGTAATGADCADWKMKMN